MNSLSLKSSKHPYHPMRIADILLLDQNDDQFQELSSMDGHRERRREGCRSADCSSPRRIISWLLSRFKEKSGKREKEKGRGALCRRCSMNGLNCGDSSSVVLDGDESGRCRREASFNLGAGFGLLYLIAASKNEFSKMMELRTQMEILLQNVKEELRRKDSLSKLSGLNDNLAYTTTDVPEGSNSDSLRSLQLHSASCVLPESETIMLCDQSSKFQVPKREDCVEGRDQLEAELEAELERLQLHLDTENLSKHLQQQNMKVTIKDTASVRSHSTSSGEVIDPQEAGTEMNCGVPPYELERRLHELLEARQQECIKELEAALECAKHKLHEKEIEISWWKDTAQLISQHIPETSRRTSQHS